jgi:hypothetical protein
MPRLRYLFTYLCLSSTTSLALVSIAAAGELNFSGYLKSYNIRQEAIEIPLIQSDALISSQNSIRLNFEGFGQTLGVDSVWQLHYEVNPVITSSATTLDTTFTNSDPLSDQKHPSDEPSKTSIGSIFSSISITET